MNTCVTYETVVSRVCISEITSRLTILCTTLHNVFFLSLLCARGNLTTASPSPHAVRISRTTHSRSHSNWRTRLAVELAGVILLWVAPAVARRRLFSFMHCLMSAAGSCRALGPRLLGAARDLWYSNSFLWAMAISVKRLSVCLRILATSQNKKFPPK